VGASPEAYLSGSASISAPHSLEYVVNLPLSRGDTLKGLKMRLRMRVKGGFRLSVGGHGVAVAGDGEGPLYVDVRPDGTTVSFGGRSYGMNLTTRDVGDTLRLRIRPNSSLSIVGDTFSVAVEFSGEPILRARVRDILGEPERYAGRRVILYVSPGGWSCPHDEAPPYPSVLSRSARILYDESGCIYASGYRVLAGRVLSEIHPIYAPGRERLTVLARVGSHGGMPYLMR